MKGDEGGIVSKAPGWKTLLLRKIKNKNAVFKHFHQNIRPIWTNNWNKIAHWEESERRELLANKFGLSQIQLGILVLVTAPGKFCSFSPSFKLGKSISSTQAVRLSDNCYFNMNISNDNLIINWVPSLFYKNSVPERLSSNLIKWNHWDFKNPNF